MTLSNTNSEFLKGNYIDERNALIEFYENEPLRIGKENIDTARNIGDGDITVGFGYDITVASYEKSRLYLLNALGYADNTTDQSLPMSLATAFQAIQKTKTDKTRLSASQLAPISLNKSQAEILLNDFLNGYGKFPGIEQKLDENLSGLSKIPDSNERIVLIDIFYHGLLGENTKADLGFSDSDYARAMTWFEIRYGGNGIKNFAPLRNGLAGRAYLDSQVFDLYGSNVDRVGNSVPNLKQLSKIEADSIVTALYRMYTVKRDTIISYDSIWSKDLTIKNFDGKIAISQIVAFNPAWSYLVTTYGAGFDIPEGNIWAAPTSANLPGISAKSLNSFVSPWGSNAVDSGSYMIIGGRGDFSGSLFSSKTADPKGSLILVGDTRQVGSESLRQLGSLDKGIWSAAKFNKGLFETALGSDASGRKQTLVIDLAADHIAAGADSPAVLENMIASKVTPSFTFGDKIIAPSDAPSGSLPVWKISDSGSTDIKFSFTGDPNVTLSGTAVSGILLTGPSGLPSYNLPDVAPLASVLLLGAPGGNDILSDAAVKENTVLVGQSNGNTLTASKDGDALISDGNNTTFVDGTLFVANPTIVSQSVVMIGGAIDNTVSKDDIFVSGQSNDGNCSPPCDAAYGAAAVWELA